jgi:2,4-dienoyl-CoA reductase-like NADH-dependent reductase (Old Yellow Enzyme family)
MATEDGGVTPKLTELMADLARGGIGLIITGHAYILTNGHAGPRQLGIYSDAQLEGLTQMVDTVHDVGGKIVAQIAHAGVHYTQRSREDVIGPSLIPPCDGKFGPFPGCRAMTQDDIDTVVDGFRQASIRVKDAGFDGIQLHGAHGYLLSEFLSPFYNRRTDQYGGSVVNRARIIVDCYNAVKAEVGPDYPIMIKMNVTDFLDDGISTEDAVQAASIYAKTGIDVIELSGGTGWGLMVLGDPNRTAVRTIQEEAYYRDMAQRLKQEVKVPIILTGGIRSFSIADQIVRDGIADYIGLCRPLIREPALVNRWKSGDTTKSGCVSDNACMFAAMEGQDLHCVHLKTRTKSE